MADRKINTKFGLLDVDLVSSASGWVAVVSGRHQGQVPLRQAAPGGPLAQSRDEAVAQLLHALESA